MERTLIQSYKKSISLLLKYGFHPSHLPFFVAGVEGFSSSHILYIQMITLLQSVFSILLLMLVIVIKALPLLNIFYKRKTFYICFFIIWMLKKRKKKMWKNRERGKHNEEKKMELTKHLIFTQNHCQISLWQINKVFVTLHKNVFAIQYSSMTLPKFKIGLEVSLTLQHCL